MMPGRFVSSFFNFLCKSKYDKTFLLVWIDVFTLQSVLNLFIHLKKARTSHFWYLQNINGYFTGSSWVNIQGFSWSFWQKDVSQLCYLKGFVCVLQVCSGQRIQTLEELFKEPLNQHRPIIVVGSATGYNSISTCLQGWKEMFAWIYIFYSF